MIKQNIDKIGKLLKDRTYHIPELLYKYYAFFSYFAQQLELQVTEFKAVTMFSDIYKLYKTYLVD